MKLYIKVTRTDYGSFIQPIDDLKTLYDEISEMQYGEVGDRLIFQLIKMDEEKYKKLGEFSGW